VSVTSTPILAHFIFKDTYQRGKGKDLSYSGKPLISPQPHEDNHISFFHSATP
jgi:hypothetical protein